MARLVEHALVHSRGLRPTIPLIAFVLVIFALSTVGCVRRDGRNSDCTWPGEPGATALDPSRSATSRHLSADTEFAEELADRYTNVHYGPHSGYVGPPIAGQMRHQCMATLFGDIARTHGVTTDEVISSYGRNRLPIDSAEILSFAVVFILAAALAVRWIRRRYPSTDGAGPTIVMLLLCSLAFGAAALLIGPIWSMSLENIRIGTGHLGPRVLRLPMERHSAIVFAVGIVLFWFVAIAAHMASPRAARPEFPEP